ncbi:MULTISPECIES: response regulator transcription factor [Pseudomonas]|uniref:Response regulator n=1 Tax=Pseudomonas sp. Hg7Tf TaxID=3236988 RepID=A0AB39I0W9_9PSED|nr:MULTISPECIES: response regulator transcription factor [Pseudomonas]KJK06789.1 LuxR family transcriptional regulator [Pseudomonas sp. 5]MDD1977350.1 response regulator transcription factor [Pseudomonas putida]MDH2560615.1 response regulator transcription factor [Pseudomonas sp. Hg5Tf]QYX46441.1 response regulator transcription factor [Pseudomonas sp. S11A 273]
MKRALIVDDHPVIRSALRISLTNHGLEVVGDTDNGVDAVGLVRQLQPDIVILDIGIPKQDGLEVITRIRAQEQPVLILVFTSLPVDVYLNRCIALGANGFVSKEENMHSLNNAITALLDGYSYFPNRSLNASSVSEIKAGDAARVRKLTDREVVILQQLALGYSNKVIAEKMLLSNKTISTYKTRILRKINADSFLELVDFAKRNNMIS